MNSPDTTPPKLTPYNLTQVMTTKRRLEQHQILLDCLGTELTAADLDQLAEALSKDLRIPLLPLRRSLRHLAGQTLSRPRLRDLAWHLAGNLGRLRRGRVSTPWLQQHADEWMPLQIVDYAVQRSRRGKLGALFQFRVLAGSAAGRLVEQFWTKQFLAFLATLLGFSKPWEKHPFHELEEVIGLRLYGLFTQQLYLRQGRLAFDKVHVTPALRGTNRQLIRKRAREGFTCPHHYEHACHLCPVGYDQCPVGTHPRTYVWRVCNHCRVEQWTDPRTRSGRCVRCDYLHRISKKDT